MRKLILAAGMLACLSLAGCSSEPAADAQTEAEAPKKSLKPVAGGGYDLAAQVTTDGAGYTRVGFLPRVYAATPPDGIYEVDVVADKPATPGAAGPTPVEVKSAWDRYKDGRVKGVKFISKTNEVVAMVAGA